MSSLGQSVVVTGGSAGVGRAIALRFARAGARVCVLARASEGLDTIRRELEDAGAEALVIAADVGDWQAVHAAAAQVAERWGGIDVWVNNAMATMYAPVSRMTCEEYARITQVSYLGYVFGAMAALHHMRRRNSGVIVQIGSALSYRAIPLQSAYCGAKFAARAFTDSLRSELAREGSGVRLSMLQLPAVNTPQFDWARNRMPSRVRPIAPVFEPEQIAEIAYKAAHDAPREVWIGLPTLKLIAGAIAVPRWLDRYLAREGFDGQLADEPAPGGPGNLFAPAPTGHTARGRFSAETNKPPFAFNPAWLRAGAAGLLAVLAFAALAGLD